jgi:hypothetical protein
MVIMVTPGEEEVFIELTVTFTIPTLAKSSISNDSLAESL